MRRDLPLPKIESDVLLGTDFGKNQKNYTMYFKDSHLSDKVRSQRFQQVNDDQAKSAVRSWLACCLTVFTLLEPLELVEHTGLFGWRKRQVQDFRNPMAVS